MGGPQRLCLPRAEKGREAVEWELLPHNKNTGHCPSFLSRNQQIIPLLFCSRHLPVCSQSHSHPLCIRIFSIPPFLFCRPNVTYSPSQINRHLGAILGTLRFSPKVSLPPLAGISCSFHVTCSKTLASHLRG